MEWKKKVTFIALILLLSFQALAAAFSVYSIKKKGAEDISQFREEETQKIKRNLRSHVDVAYSVIDAYYKMSTDREFLEINYGARLKNIIDVAEGILKSKADMAKTGLITASEAKAQALAELRNIRYGGGTGYVWVNDAELPDTRILMHPIDASLQGIVNRKEQRWYCALGKGRFLFDAFIEVCKAKGEGFVDYVWDKPAKDGVMHGVPKLSYVRLFKEWGWIIGTGIYVDDAILDGIELSKATVRQMRYDGGVGYFWINDTAKPTPRMVMHPTIPSLDGKVLDDPKFNCALGKGKNLFEAFVEVAEKNGDGFVDYLWPKPTKEGLTEEMPKLSYVRLYEPLGWVVGSGVYIDDVEKAIVTKGKSINRQVSGLIIKIFFFSLFACAMTYLALKHFINRYADSHLPAASSAPEHTAEQGTAPEGPKESADEMSDGPSSEIVAVARDICKLIVSEQTKLLAFNAAAMGAAMKNGTDRDTGSLHAEVRDLAAQILKSTEGMRSEVKELRDTVTENSARLDDINNTLNKMRGADKETA